MDAFTALKQELQTNPICAANWHANLVAASVREGVDSVTASCVATRFMLAYFQVVTNG